MTEAIDACCFDERLRNLRDELSVHEDKKCVAEVRGYDERQDGIDPTKLAEKQEERDHRDLPWQHHRREHQEEHAAAPAESKSRKRVTNET